MKSTKTYIWDHIFEYMKDFQLYFHYYDQLAAVKADLQLIINKISTRLKGKVDVANQVIILLNNLPDKKLQALGMIEL